MFEQIFEKRNLTLDDSKGWFDIFTGGQTISGESVTNEGSLNVGVVYSAVNIKANAVAKMPIHTFKRAKGGKEREHNHEVVELLETRPNPHMTAFTFKHTATVHEEVWGNAYIWIEFNKATGKPKSLWLLNPADVTMYLDKSNNLWYLTKINDKDYKFRNDEIIHWKSLSTDGLIGKSRIEVARETLGNIKSSTRFISEFYKNGAMNSGIITHPDKMNSDAKENVRKAWQNANAGLDNAGKVAILDMGLDFKSIQMPLADAEFISTNKFNIAEISRIFNVPLHKLSELDRSTFSNIEQQAMEFIQDSIQPLITGLEEEITYKLFTNKERKNKGYYVKFNLASALRGDSESRSKFYKEMLGMGVYSINEVRGYEDKNGIGEMGDKHLVSLNYTTLDNIEKYQLAKAGLGGGEDIE